MLNIDVRLNYDADTKPLVFVPQVFDLTQMFGATIADYIYSLEQSTAGAGIAWFKNLFPKDYYPYNEGEETHVSAVNGDEYRHIPITFPSEAGTVYGGTLDVTTGLLTVTMAEVDLGTLTWTLSNISPAVTSGIRIKATLSGAAGAASSVKANAVCSAYSIATGSQTYSGTTGLAIDLPTSGNAVQIFDSAYSDLSTFAASLSGVDLVYELATTQTYQLSPTDVALLLGDNNVWADTGDTTVTYRADTKLYIQKINTPTDDDMIADAQIASGKYFIVGGNLYRSTTTIPAGDTITPGTNCILTNLADALNALNT